MLLSGLLYLAIVIPGYAFGYFAPTIINTYTIGTIRTQLLSVPPWACGFVSALGIAALSDRVRHRFLFVAVPLLFAIAGYCILLTVHTSPSTQYAAMFLIVLGIWTPLPIIVCWTTMNVRGSAERAVAIGWIIGFGNIGGIPAVYLFLQEEAPTYTRGFAVSLACVILSIFLSAAYAGLCWLENRKILRNHLTNNDGVEAVPVDSTDDNEHAPVLNMI